MRPVVKVPRGEESNADAAGLVAFARMVKQSEPAAAAQFKTLRGLLRRCP